MASKSLAEFINNFAKLGRNEECYGNYYTVAGEKADVLLYYEDAATSVLKEDDINVVMIRIKGSRTVIFFNDSAINSKRSADRHLPSNSAKTYANISFSLPRRTFDVTEDLTNLSLVDSTDQDFLFELPTGKFMISILPTKKCRKKDLDNFIPNKDESVRTILVPVPSMTMKASKAAITPDGLDDNAIFIGGVWFQDLGEKDIKEFMPTPEEVEVFNSRPKLTSYIHFYDALLQTGINYSGIIDSGHYDYSAPFSGEASNGIPVLAQEAVTRFRKDLEAWKVQAKRFASKYVGFSKHAFIGDSYQLVSSESVLARYYFDGTNRYVKGSLTPKINYDRSSSKEAIIMPTWHKMISVVNKHEVL
jgi:hypothetical protein